MTETLTPRSAAAARGRRDARLEFDLGNTEATGDNQRLANLCGPLDANLAQIAAAYGVQVSRRHAHFTVEGSGAANRQARDAIMHFHGLSATALSLDDIQLGLVELRGRASAAEAGTEAAGPDDSPVLHTRRTDLQGRTPRQREYLRNILAHDVCFGIGPAGTGKTYLAVACAVAALESDQVRRILLVRPAVEAGEKLGFLPGDLAHKIDPYLRPLYDALYEMMGFEHVAKLIERHVIEVCPLAYMRGRTLNNAFVILDESQNTTPEQMKMFLTRIGFGSKAVITGDITQVDLPRGTASGLAQVVKFLDGVEGIGFTWFSPRDVVRHPLVQRIVEAYEAFENDNRNPAAPGRG